VTRTPAPRLAASIAATAVCAAIAASPAAAGTGGASLPGSPDSTGPTGKAKLKSNGKAIPPSDAPSRVVKAIEAANEIRRTGYQLGGGHKRWKSKNYDCSGAVSYALHGAGMLSSPLPSGSLAKWGKKGDGRWITVYANGGHTYAMIAGLRWDTSGTGGKGPRWQEDKSSSRGYKVRHFKGY